MAQDQGIDRVPDARLPRKHWPATTRVFFSLFGLALFGGILAAAAGFYGYQEYTLPGPLKEKIVFNIEKGKGVPDIAVALQDAGIISDARVFSAITYLKKARGGTMLKAGEYEFAAAAPMRDVMALIESGKTLMYKVSIPEGFTSFAAMARVLENDVLTGEVTEQPLEGAILPDTYVFKRGLTKQKLIDDMEAAQAKLLDDLWQKRDPAIPLKSKEEAVVLASIVEKETGKAEERGVIASVFYNRLRNNMRLQSDPTIIYGITLGKGKLERALTKADITTPTPYNTYTINGLPPGPIANPGRAALEAVLKPPATNYLYFVADGTGGHAFAETLEEHNRNVAEWRKINAQAPATAMEEQPAPDVQTANANSLPAIDDPAAQLDAPEAPGDAATATTDGTAEGAGDNGSEIPTPDATATDGLPAPADNQGQQQAAVEADTVPADASTKPADVPEAGEPAADVPAKLIPTPRPKPANLVTAAAEDVSTAATGELKPGSVITVGKRLIPIPKNKPKS